MPSMLTDITSRQTSRLYSSNGAKKAADVVRLGRGVVDAGRLSLRNRAVTASTQSATDAASATSQAKPAAASPISPATSALSSAEQIDHATLGARRREAGAEPAPRMPAPPVTSATLPSSRKR
jgi:hypothetical protein